MIYKKESVKNSRETINNALNNLQNNYKNWRYKVSIDVDPV